MDQIKSNITKRKRKEHKEEEVDRYNEYDEYDIGFVTGSDELHADKPQLQDDCIVALSLNQ